MGGKTTTSTNQVTIPQDVLDRYNAVNTQAAKVAENPFQKYGTTAEDFVAQFNEQQNKGVAGINAVAGMGAAYENVDKYLNPYIKNVADTTRAQMEQAQEQAQSGALGTAVQSGAFGGDRAGVAAANLANQNQMAMGSTMANIYNQGYTQAIDTSMNDRNRMLGVAGAQLGAGTQMQQTEQAGLDALINQFQQEQGYPFQVAQFLANIAMGTGALSGSTTTTTQPAQIFSDRRLKHDIKKIGEADNGLPIYTFKYKGDEHHQTHVGFMADEVEKTNPDAVGLDPSGYKTVDYDKAAQSMGGGVHSHNKGEAFADGGVAGPYSTTVGQGVGVGSYVPQAYLPVGELMMADPAAATAHQTNVLDALNSAAAMGKSVVEIRDLLNKKAYGGVAGGYAGGGGVEPKLHGDYLSGTLAAQEAGKDKNELMTAKPAEKQESALGNIASTLGSIATIAKIIPFSDRRLKHDIKRIGKTEKGLPIYTFKYKGDDREQTHVGFMADEVERDHPEAVGKRDGYKTVDYSQAHKFADGGVAGRHGYALDGTVEERLRDAMRLTRDDVPAAQTLGSLPDASVMTARDADNSYRKMPAIFSDEATRIMADREGKGLGEYLSSLGQEAMSAKFADAERRAANQITSSDSVFNENLPVRGTQTGSNDISSKFDRVRDEALLGLGANASQAFTDADYYGTNVDQGMPKLLTARETFNQENPPSQMRGPDDFRAQPERPSIYQEIGGTIGEIAQNYREAALREARKASMGSTASMPPPEMTWPEYLASLEVVPTGLGAIQEVGTRIGDALEIPVRINLGAASQIGGLAAGLFGYPDAGNQAVNFARDQFGNAALAAQDLVGSAEDRESRAANRAIAAAPLTVDQRPRPRPVEGGVAAGAPGVEDESARFYRMAAANRFNAENAAPTGVAPVEGQMRPRPRPEGLGAAAAPVVAGDLGAAKPAAPVIVGTTMTPAEKGSPFDLDRLAAATRLQESGSPSGNYGAIGKPVKRGDGFDYAYGAYGIMGANIPSWTKEVLGKSMTPDEFLRDPQAQDTVAKAKLAEYHAKYGNIEDVASMWFSGKPFENNTSVDATSGMTVPEYVSDMVSNYYGGGVGPAANYDIASIPGGVAGGAGQGTVFGAGNEGRRGGVKPYEERNALGRVLYDEDGRLNKNAMLSLFAGLGDMLSSPSPFLLPAIGAGVAGAAKTYMAREGQVADIAKTQAETNEIEVATDVSRFFSAIPGSDGFPLVIIGPGKAITLTEFLKNPIEFSTGDEGRDAAILQEAQRIAGEGGANTPSGGPQGAPSGVRWSDASNEAVQKAIDKLENRPGDFSSNDKESRLIMEGASQARSAALANKPNSNELAFTVSSAIGANNMGTAEGYLSSTFLPVLNAALRSVDPSLEISDADDQQQILRKLSRLSAANMTPEEQRAASVFQEFVSVSPDLRMTPEAAATITASMMLQDQDAIDRANYYSAFMSRAGSGVTMSDVDAAYANEYSEMHQIEKDAMKQLLLLSSDREKGGTVRDFFSAINSGSANQADAQAVLTYILGEENTPPLLARWLIKGM